MGKINHRRRWKIRIQIPKPDRIIEPDTIYDRHKEKDKWQREIKRYVSK